MKYAALAVTLVGVVVLFYSAFKAYRLREKLGRGRLKEAWDRLTALIMLFIVGYVLFIIQLVTDVAFLDMRTIAGALFLAGSVFVAAVAHYNYEALT
ncbi:MAG: hypothetical protein ABEK01_00415 [Candidatus Nanohaloarchaea archaeon]